MRLKHQDRNRKDTVVSEFYHQSKLAGFNIKVAYRDYSIRKRIIDAVIYTSDREIVCFVIIHQGDSTIKIGGVPTFYLSNADHIPITIKLIKELI